MQFKMNTKEWKEIIENATFATQLPYNEPLLVMDVNSEFDGQYGQGPFNMAFAYHDFKTKKWMSYQYPGDEICYHDFRDVANHNGGGHTGEVSHAIDAYKLSCIILYLLTENETLKKQLKKFKDDAYTIRIPVVNERS